MKVVFLDIDGVLNANEDFGGRSKPNPTIGGLMGIAVARVKRLKKIVDATDAKIVLISSWKKHYVHYDMFGKYLRNKLRKEGLEIFDTTLDYEKKKGSYYRGTGIFNWLAVHEEVKEWIVLDDELFDDYDETIKRHLVKTNWETGLTDELTEKAIEMLK